MDALGVYIAAERGLDKLQSGEMALSPNRGFEGAPTRSGRPASRAVVGQQGIFCALLIPGPRFTKAQEIVVLRAK